VLVCCVLGIGSPSLATAAGGWVTDGQIAAPTIASQVSAVAPSGEIIDAWARSEGTYYQVEVTSRAPGGSFSAPLTLSAKGAYAAQPSVAFDAAGDAIVVWAVEGLLEYAFRPAGGAFEKPKVVSEAPRSSSPRVVFTSTGEAVVVWVSSSGPLGGPFTYTLESSSRPPAGGAFGPAQQLDSIGPAAVEEYTDGIFTAHPVADGQGNVVLSWERLEEHRMLSETTSQSSIEVASRPAGGAFSAPVALASATNNALKDERLEAPSDATDAKGDALVVWPQSKSSEVQQIEGSYQPAGGTFETTPEIVSGARPESSESRPALAADGTATVVWVATDAASKKRAVIEADRPAAGAFSTPQLVSDPSAETGESSPGQPAIAVAPSGETTVVWVRYQESSRVEAAVRPPGGVFGGQQPISANGQLGAVEVPQVGLDSAGDAGVTWTSGFASEWAARDVSGPSLGGLSIPATASVGQPVSFAVSPLDAFSALGSNSWSFGDGTSGIGASVTHVYTHAGKFTVGLTSMDALANPSSASGTITVAAAGSSTPKLTAVRESNKLWRRGSKLARLARRVPVGTTFSFVLDQDARVTLSFTQPAKGRRVGHSCLAPSRHNRHRARCTRTITRGSLALAARSGLNKIVFQGRVSKSRRLAPGGYSAVIVAANSTGQRSTPARLQMTIIR
jgi:PKD domain